MNNKFIFIPGLFALGMLAGIAIMNSRAPVTPVNAPIATVTAPEPAPEPVPNPFASLQTPASGDRVQALQNQLDRLSQRVDQLEQHIATKTSEPETDETSATPEPPPGNAIMSNAVMKRALSVANLVKAGVNPELADDIIRRKNDIDLKKLELRDRATREQYLGTNRYNRELNALTAEDVSLREELGDTAYDKYLYASGQNNRVRVTSVMNGSQAEIAGVQNGDIILSYDDQNLFDWSELQQATTQGERGEYVNVNIERDGQTLNLWVPRGPLGVRLGAARLEP
jgi:hypothetical protein